MRALLIGSHTDDIEIGCGGYIQRFKEKRVIVFSPATESIPKEFHPLTTKLEFVESCKLMRCSYELYDFPVRRFSEHRQDILELLIKERNSFNPDIVFTHCSTDIHNDHSVINIESIRAFKGCSILGYNIDTNNLVRKFNYFIELTDSEMQNKLNFISVYKSQLAKKDYLGFVKTNAEYWGSVVGKKYVEPFEVIRWIEKSL